MTETLQQSVQQLFDDLEELIMSTYHRLGSWLNEPVNGDTDYTLGVMLSGLSCTVGSVRGRTHLQTIGEWTQTFKKRYESMGIMVSYNELGEKIELACCVQNELSCVMQEASCNSMKHGKASVIQILVIYVDKGLKLTIADNGVGMQEANFSKNGKGTQNIKSRVDKLNGTVQWLQNPECSGTVVVIDIPSLCSRVPACSDSEENVIASELHDVLCPELIGVTMMLANMKRQLTEIGSEQWNEFNDSEEKLNEYSAYIRSLSHEIS